SLLNRDSSIIPSSSKIDSLLDEFAGELTLLKSIPPGIDKTDYHPENEIRLSHRLLYDNSSPRPPEEFVFENSNADAESFSPFPILEEIDLTFTPDNPMPPSIEEDDDDSRDILIREELLDNYSLLLPENESFHFDIPSFSRPLAKPPDGVNPLIDHHCCYECGNSLNDFFCHECTCEFCGNGAHVGYNCPAQVPSFQTLPSFPQQYPCCEDCKLMEQMTQLTSMCEMACQIVQKKQEEKKIEEEQATKSQNSKIPACCDDDDDYNSAITPNEPVDSLSMGDKHLNTILATESDEFIKSCIENLVPNPSESEGKNGCDVPASFTTFSNILFDAEYEFDSVDDQSLSDEDFQKEIFSNPLFEEEIISTKIDPHHFDVESDLIESMLNHDSSIIPSSSKIDSFLDEFAGELTLLKSIPPGIDKTDCYSEEDIRLIERLLYDNSSPRPPEEFVFENSNADIESFSPSPIPVEDSDSFMEEINLTFTLNDPMPPGIEEDDDDSGRDILIREELLDNYSLSLPLSSILGNVKTLAKGFYPPSLHFLSFGWES
nr:hypothetical protein [Tanacetum cinerariifolium]